MRESLKDRLARGGTALGTWIAFVQAPGVVRMIAEAGFDFCAIDLQHSSLGIEAVSAMCDVARASGIVPIVRPAVVSQAEVNRLQDSGATGIMFPDVRSRADIDIYRSWLLYPPAGTRGSGSAVSGSDYDLVRDADALAAIDNQVLLGIQIEHPDSVKALAELLSGGGVDLVEIGRNDLAASMRTPGRLDDPELRSAVKEVVRQCAKFHVAVGTTADDAAEALELRTLGIRTVCVSTDRRLLANFYRSACKEFWAGAEAKRS